MRKHGIILSVYSIIATLYIALTLILTTDRNTVFWIGFAMVLFAVGVTAVITVVTNQKRSSAFPLEISMVVFSAIYVAVVVAINILFGFIFNTAVNIFISIHLICMALYAIITVLMFATKNMVIKQNNQVNGKICEMQILIYEFEKIKTKDGLSNCTQPFDNNTNYQKIIRYGDVKLVKDLESIANQIKDNIELARKDSIYIKARESMNNVSTEKAYKDIAKGFESLGDFKDSLSLQKECLEKAEILRINAKEKDRLLSQANAIDFKRKRPGSATFLGVFCILFFPALLFIITCVFEVDLQPISICLIGLAMLVLSIISFNRQIPSKKIIDERIKQKEELLKQCDELQKKIDSIMK